MTTIYITKNFCDCRLCSGSEKIETDLDREAHNAFRQGWVQILIGARNPSLITFDPRKLLVGHESAASNLSVDDDAQVDRGLQEVFSASDSVHGCWKMRENQRFLLFLRWEFATEEVATIETR